MSTCDLCTLEARPNSPYCGRCRKLLDRKELRPGPAGKRRINMEARRVAMKEACRRGVFHCYFTDLPLTETHLHPLYATWEHRTPGDESSVVLAADFVNKMKGNLNEDEFSAVVIALARRFESGADFDQGLVSRLTDQYIEDELLGTPRSPADRFIWKREDVTILCGICRKPIDETNEDCPNHERHG